MIDAGAGDVRERLEVALGVRRWVDDVVRAGPYPTLEELTAAVVAAGADLTDEELDEAIARAAPATGPDAAGLAPGEGLGRADEGLEAAIARGAEVYEQRFGRRFLIDTTGLTSQQLLDALQRRLTDDPADEAAEAKRQLLSVAVRRVATLFPAER